MTPRTLRSWQAKAAAPPGRAVGRPPQPALWWRAALRAVREALAACGMVGWRTVHAWLGGRWSVYVVQRAVAREKRRRKRRAQAAREVVAQHIHVAAAGAVWALDATHVGRDPQGRAIEAQPLRDNGSRLLLAADLGPPACGQDVLALLEAGRAVHGELPLVLQSDNGSAYTCRVLGEYLARHRVVHIRNLPHTPQHNGAAERTHAELKAETGLGKGVRLGALQDAGAALASAMTRLARRPRGILGYASALTQHRTTTRRYTAEHREEVHEACQRAMADALQGPGTLRARRLAARHAALDVLRQHHVITITTGNDDRHTVKPEGIT